MNPHAKKSGANPDQREKAAPPPPLFDTLQVVERLKNAEFGEKQAGTLVETLQDVQNELATRADLERTEFALRADMAKMESGIRTDMAKMESSIRSDMVEMKSDLRGEIQALYAKMEDRFQKVQWFILSSIGGATGILGMMRRTWNETQVARHWLM